MCPKMFYFQNLILVLKMVVFEHFGGKHTVKEPISKGLTTSQNFNSQMVSSLFTPPCNSLPKCANVLTINGISIILDDNVFIFTSLKNNQCIRIIQSVQNNENIE